MREFFRGWRRKIGVVTLATACLLAFGWVRSLVIVDQVAVAIDASGHFVTSPFVITTNHFLTSKNGCIRWIRYEIGSNGVNPAYVNPFSIWTKVQLDSPSEPFDESNDTSAHRSINNLFAYLSITEIRKNFVGEHYWQWRYQWSQFDFGNGQAYGDAPMFVHLPVPLGQAQRKPGHRPLRPFSGVPLISFRFPRGLPGLPRRDHN